MGTGRLTLAFNYPARGGRPAVKETLAIDMVVNVERSVNVNLTEMPTLIYGYRNNFCMDLGATEKVTFKCERNNPPNYSDSSSDPARWSNGKWYRHLEDLFDRWQNFGLNAEGVQTGGCTLSFDPEDEALMAPISGNAFLVGALSPDYSVQKMAFSLPMQFATMKPGSSGAAERVTLTLVTTDDSGTTHRSTVSVLKNYPQTVPLPDGWENLREGTAFMGWRMGSTVIASNATYTFQSDATLTAIWNAPFSCVFCTSDVTLTVPDGVNYLKAYIVGGGGGAGGGRTKGSGVAPTIKEDLVGGGGGAGEAISREAFVYPGDTVTVSCGSGGSNGKNSTTSSIDQTSVGDGGDGGATIVRISSGSTWSASGGQGGKACNIPQRLHGSGGSQYVAGGTHGSGYSGGRDGGFASPNIADNAGKGGRDDESAEKMGGNGGGAAAFRYRFTLTDGTVMPSSTEWYESKGGNGKDAVDGTNPTDGTYGGGGGSGMRDGTSSGKGGKGCALILMFKNVVS